MIRIVFEDPLEISENTLNLSDKTIQALYPCKNLHIMAITRCKFMTGESFANFLKRGQISTLDLHKDPNNSIGELNENFAEIVLSSLCHAKSFVSVLNLFGQNSLSSDFLYSCLIRGFFSSVKSLSLNHTLIDENFLFNILEYCPVLEFLSIKNCSLITTNCVKLFLDLVNPKSKFKKLYALDNQKDFDTKNQLLELDDSWFGEQRLDITSLWYRFEKIIDREDAIYPL